MATTLKRVCDLEPGTGSAAPHDLVTCGGQLFMVATTAASGNEVYRLQKPGATASILGEACGPGYPSLWLTKSPVLGTTVDIVVKGPATYTGFLVVGPSINPTPGIPAIMNGGCDWASALSLGLILASTTSANHKFVTLIPNQAALDGTKLNLQMWWANGGVTPMFQVSNGVQVVLSKGAPQ